MTEPSGHWSDTTIAGKQADIFEPTTPADPARAILHLHGHGLTTLRDNPVWTQELERHGLYAICPHGQRSWWLDIVCSEFDESVTPMAWLRESVVPWIGENWKIEPPAIGLTGISMGGQGVLQLCYRHARKFPVVAAVSPAIDFDRWVGQGLPLDDMFATAEDARQQTVTLHIHPLDWPRHQLIVCDPVDSDWCEGADRLSMKLSSSGVAFESDLETSHGGHSWDYFDHMAPRVVEFVAKGLDRVIGAT